MSDSVQPHRQQPNRLLCPWDSPGKNTGVGCHFLLQTTQGNRLSCRDQEGRRGRQRMRWLDGITDLMHMSLSVSPWV